MGLTFQFSDEQIADILIGAQEGGSGYWCISEGNLADALQGKTIRIYDREEPNTQLGELTGEKLRGVGAVLASKVGRHIVEQFAAEADDPGCVDASAADCFLQIAVFGELVYG